MRFQYPLRILFLALLCAPTLATANSSIFLTSGTLSDNTRISKIPKMLKQGIREALTTPYRFRMTITDSLVGMHVLSWGKIDLEERDGEVTAQIHPIPGVIVTAQSITIGNKTWYRLTPPGGAFQEDALPIKIPKVINWQEIEPYLQDIQKAPETMINGRPSIGYNFILDQEGIRKLIRYGGDIQIGTVESAQGTIWVDVNGVHYIRKTVLIERMSKDGYPYKLNENIEYGKWGKMFDLIPPQ